MVKTIILFNDGTGQNLDSESPSNVLQLYQALPGEKRILLHSDSYKVDETLNYHSVYIRGVGTDSLVAKEPEQDDRTWREKFGDFISGKISTTKEYITGKSIQDRIDRTLKCLESLWSPGDIVIAIGFSRGAASLRLAMDYQGRNVVGFQTEYLLVFDTVYSVLGEVKIGNETVGPRFQNFDIDASIKYCDHIIAGDEMRSMFPLTPVNPRENVRQILFAGAHSDVGGGNPSQSLSDISLLFSINALKANGIQLDEQSISNLQLQPDPTAKITFDRFNGTGQKHYPRDLAAVTFLIHNSVFIRANAKESVSIALAQLSTFTTTSKEELVTVNTVDSSFDY
ncbi:phospholipase effector Tle1 domain-containing protein [Bdellovibrio sp. HCB288]|uniref:phospholipase effector Tle1 domain-containing protein n=1 Tax=Bdellovibrio sp. HCB288 TaxID=3394355 RepID=UPI0039B649FC